MAAFAVAVVRITRRTRPVQILKQNTLSNLQAPDGEDQNYPPPSYPPQPQPGFPPASNNDSQPPVLPTTLPNYTNYPPEYNTNNQPPDPPSYQQSLYQAPYPPTNNQET